MKFSVTAFTGVAPKFNPRHLGEGGAQKALNVEAFGQTLRPLRGYSDPVTSVPSGSQSIYRFGQGGTNPAQYWLAWPGDVDVCRSHIANDTNEWTFITDGVYPKATNNATLQDDVDPAIHEWVRLGLPDAATAATATPAERGPSMSIGKETWGEFSTTVGLSFSATGGVTFTQAVTLTDVSSAAAVATAINAAFTSTGHVLALVQGDVIRLFGSAGLRTSTLGLSWTTAGTVTLFAAAYEIFVRVITPFWAPAWRLTIAQTSWGTWTTGTALSLTGGTSLGGSTLPISLPSVASLTGIRDRIIAVLQAAGYAATSNTYYTPATATPYYDFIVYVSDTYLVIDTRRAATGGTDFKLSWPGQSAKAKSATWKAELPEARVYTWTWVSKVDSIEMESAAAPPSKVVDTAPVAGWVDLTLPASVSSGQSIRVTHKRIYRTVGVGYAFVAEIDGQATTFRDFLPAEELGELLPEVATAAQPRDTLLGLTSLPNGLLAGFVNQDLFFSLPYRPYAWPVAYTLAVDTPIVGLGAIDTTLVVLTKGAPYFVQGTAPGSLVMIKAGLDQACSSKRSIVSMNGAVMYASPDGLITLSPAGSDIITADLFSREDWQKLNPETIHAYGHDLRYIAFHDPDPDGATGFVYDATSGEFIKHTLTATAGYQDLRDDALYLVTPDGSVVKWGQGNRLTGVWRSKKVTLPHMTSFALAQIEAEAYGVCVIAGGIDPDYTTAAACATAGGTWTYPSLEVYMDGVAVHTQTVTARDPFRLPAVPGRDLELELDTCSEVFAVNLAHAAEELFNE